MNEVELKNLKCFNCNTILYGPVCHLCGQKRINERWTTKGMISQFATQVTDIEKGFLYTARSLMLIPGIFIRDYWQRKTVLAYNPFRYFLILLALNIIINFWLGIDDLLEEYLTPAFVEDQYGSETLASADQKFDTWLNALVILLLPVFSLLTRWLFSRHDNNYAEHLIMNAFVMGQQSLITSCTHFIFYLIPSLFSIYLVFNFLVGLCYNTYVFRKVFGENWWWTFGKALLIGVLGIVVFFALVAGASAVAIGLS